MDYGETQCKDVTKKIMNLVKVSFNIFVDEGKVTYDHQ